MNKSSLGLLASFAGALISIFRMITKSMGVVENAVNMAHASVEVAAEEQVIELTLKRFDLKKRLVDAAAIRAAQQEEVLQSYGSKSDEHQKMINTLRANLDEQVNQALAARKIE